MPTQPTSATTKYLSQQPNRLHTLVKKDTASGFGHQDSLDALTHALLDPFLTVEEATVQALIQRHHPPNQTR